MTTRQRLDLLTRAFPLLFPRAELNRLVRTQLGHIDALDAWVRPHGLLVRARAPRLIYHICAGNLAVSAWTSIGLGLLIGAHNVVKLPGFRDDPAARDEIVRFIKGLPAPLRRLVQVHKTLDPETLRSAEIVVAFGSDETMASLRAQMRWDQKFIAHGHAVSLLWLAVPKGLNSFLARACAVDILTYDQLGCLSPQAVYVRAGAGVERFGDDLARGLEVRWQEINPKPARPLAIAARIAEARDLAYALGHRVWLPPAKHLGWTLIHDPDPTFQPSPLHGVIYLREVEETKIGAALASVAGRISTVGIAGMGRGQGFSSRLEEAFLSLGVSRFCPAGRMQFPPLTWHHDGHAALADLVTWVDADPLRFAQ